MTTHTWTFALQNLPSIYQLGSNFVKELFRIQIQKDRKVLLWNQLKSRIEACYSERILSRFLLGRFSLIFGPIFVQKMIIIFVVLTKIWPSSCIQVKNNLNFWIPSRCFGMPILFEPGQKQLSITEFHLLNLV